MFKGTVQRDFWLPVFFIIWTSLGQPGLKYFRFWLGFCWVIRIFMNLPGYHTAQSQSPRVPDSARNQSPRGIIPRQVIGKNLCLNLPGVIIPQGVSLPGVSYLRESIKNLLKHDSPGYDTPRSQCKELSIRPSNSNTCFICMYNFPGWDWTHRFEQFF